MAANSTASRAGDKYVNLLTQNLVMTGANTHTNAEVDIGLSLFDKVGILVQRAEYHIAGGAIAEMTTTGDYIDAGFGTNDGATAINPQVNSVIDGIRFLRMDFGTAGSGTFSMIPITRDFSDLRGGGLLITPRPWILMLDSNGLASAQSCVFRFYFAVIKLAAAEYFELLETRHYFGQ